MKAYENGSYTKKLILNACQKSFYEKGFHETSQNDICRLAHTSRSIIYYHFKDMDNIRYAVFWEWHCLFAELAGKYCPEKKYQYLLASYIAWKRSTLDFKICKFQYDFFMDYPVYSSAVGCGRWYTDCFDKMYGMIWDINDVKSFYLEAAYSYLAGLTHLIYSSPGIIDGKELFIHIVRAETFIWKIKTDSVEQLIIDFEKYMNLIPDEEILSVPLYK